MDKKVADAIVKTGVELGIELHAHEYSGRGMFGKVTTAITIDTQGEFMECVAAASCDLTRLQEFTSHEDDDTDTEVPDFCAVEDFIQACRKFRMDSMGHAVVVY